MRHRTSISIGLAAAAILGVTAAMVIPGGIVIGSQAPAPDDNGQSGAGGALEEEGEEGPPGDYYLFRRFADGGSIAPGTFERAAAQARTVSAQSERRAPRVAGQEWSFVGPTNIGGRVVDVVVDPEREGTIYTAAASGGVWKSTDAGDTFTPIWGNRMPQAMGALEIAPDGTLYAGTGETSPGGGSLTYGGDGVYKSTDRGQTWQHVGLDNSARIGRIAVDPTDSDHVFVAVSGNLFVPGGQRGVYESTDAGRTWEHILEAPNDTTGAADIQVDPENPDNVYVAMWDHIRYPGNRVYTGPGSGIYRSNDGGDSFQRLGPTNGLPPSSEGIGRIALGLDPQQPQRLYALYINDAGAFQSFFISTDGGDTWATSPTANATLAESQSVYGWWFGRIWVDPKDSNHVYVAGVPLMESMDGGQSFPVRHSQPHVDHHGMAWSPHVEGRVYNGNDGGVYRSEENGAAGTWTKATYQPWSQFFTIDVAEQQPSRINGGLQDMGSVRSWGGEDWNNYNGGDGVKNAIDPNDKQNVFACSQYGSCVRSDDGGDTTESMSKVSLRNGWLTPIEFQPGETDTMYWAGSRVNRSTDSGRNWDPISPDLGKGEQGGETNPLYANHYGTVQAVELNRAEPDTIYAGTDNGYLWKTQDQGGNWTELTSDTLPDRWITAIEAEPENPDTVYVAYSGYRQGDHTAYVLRSTDGGQTWTDISANLPEAPLNDLELVDDTLYTASDVGAVYATATDDISWLRVGENLPRNPINDLRYVPTNEHLYAGTFGRGIYRIDPPDLPRSPSTGNACPPDRVPEDGFGDVPEAATHEATVDCMAWWQVTAGTSADTYAPRTSVTRAQMATFIANTLTTSGGDLPDDPSDHFNDDTGSAHETSINRLAEAGLVSGVTEDTYAPNQPVSRAQMASFLVGAYEHRAETTVQAAGDFFTDDTGSGHEDSINRAATVGFTTGVGDSSYAPTKSVERAPMASFLARVLDLLVEDGLSSPPDR